MLAALDTGFPSGVAWSHPDGGYFLWLDLGDGGDTAELARRAEQDGVSFVRGADFFPVGSNLGKTSARLAFSYEPPERITEGIGRLSRPACSDGLTLGGRCVGPGAFDARASGRRSSRSESRPRGRAG